MLRSAEACGSGLILGATAASFTPTSERSGVTSLATSGSGCTCSTALAISSSSDFDSSVRLVCRSSSPCPESVENISPFPPMLSPAPPPPSSTMVATKKSRISACTAIETMYETLALK